MKSKRPSRNRIASRTKTSANATSRNVSVVIPVLNESRTIARIVRMAVAHPRVSEVLVVDDGSHDGTPELAESLGAVESLIEHPGRMTHASVAGSALEVPPNLVRLSVGLESASDLVADLAQALDAGQAGG